MVKEYYLLCAPWAKLLLLTWHRASSEVLGLGEPLQGVLVSAVIMNTIVKNYIILTLPLPFAQFPCKKSVSAVIPSVFSHLQVLGTQLSDHAKMLLFSKRMWIKADVTYEWYLVAMPPAGLLTCTLTVRWCLFIWSSRERTTNHLETPSFLEAPLVAPLV